MPVVLVGLIHEYLFTEGAGTTVADSIGGQDIVVSSFGTNPPDDPTWNGLGMIFTKTCKGLRNVAANIIPLSATFSVECWINSTGTFGGDSYNTFCGAVFQSFDFDISPSGGDIIVGSFLGSDGFGNEVDANPADLVTVNAWHQVVYVLDLGASPRLTIYIDTVAVFDQVGVEAPAGTFTFGGAGVYHPPMDSGNGAPPQFTVGCDGFNDKIFDGQLSETRVYDTALSAADVLQNYNATIGRFTPMPATATAVPAYKDYQVWDLDFTGGDTATVNHSIGSSTLDVSIYPTGAVSDVPGIVFTDDNTITVTQVAGKGGTFRLSIKEGNN